MAIIKKEHTECLRIQSPPAVSARFSNGASVLHYFKKLHIALAYDQIISLSGIYSRQMRTYVHTKNGSQTFAAAGIFIMPRMETTQWASWEPVKCSVGGKEELEGQDLSVTLSERSVRWPNPAGRKQIRGCLGLSCSWAWGIWGTEIFPTWTVVVAARLYKFITNYWTITLLFYGQYIILHKTGGKKWWTD